ncbi:hypothetical protein [Microbulbifer sp. HZ11]|uniref:hypothetical protein n=1 Tax=Microbulbifer sp. HZ11 TaxID=1453501 RepID=UPI0005B8F12C|nr:hypothetical protein [Microbulbifer sp. HZ11]
MESLAKAVIQALMFFELVEDNVLDPDTALKNAENLIAELEDCTNNEKSELLRVCKDMALKERQELNRKDVVQFLEQFNESYFPNY